MTQFNLLPDVKLQYIRSQRVKQTVVGVAVITGAASLFVLIVMFLVVNVFQKKYISDINTDIKNSQDQLNQIADLSKILTIQNQLNSLPTLHSNKPVASRLAGYLAEVVPADIDIGTLNLDFDKNTMIITGTSKSLTTVNKFVDTLKFTTFTKDGTTDHTNAFDAVVLSSFTVTDTDKKTSTYTVTLNFKPEIFNGQSGVTLSVPQGKITTRSETEKPLFKELPKDVQAQ